MPLLKLSISNAGMLRACYLLACLLVCFSLHAQVTNGLVADYSFNEGTPANDVGSNPAKVVGATLVDDRFGNARSAYYLHGTYGSYLNLGTSSALKPTRATILLWFKIDTPIEAGKGFKFNPLILTKCQPGDDFFEAYCIYYHLETGQISAASTLSSLNQCGLHSGKVISPHEWHCVAMSYDDDYLCLYLDGKQEGKIAKNFATHFLPGDSVMVGNSANTKNKRFFNGSIDDIRIYNRVLSPAEIEELYYAPNPNRFGNIKKWLLLSALLLTGVTLIILYITSRYRRALRREKVKNELQNQLYNMEIRVMKAQMNPHFVFNSLNAIQHFILANDNDKAYKYLTKFSKLVRRLLESNEANYITLTDEIDILERYLEIEELRFEGSFQFKITCHPDLLSEKTHIPHMLIQPFVENALWHGLLHKRANRQLAISFLPANEKSILVVVEDNGVGRTASTEETTGKKSMAIEMIRQRLRLIEKVHGIKGGITIHDKQNSQGHKEGTRVELKIPVFKYESDHH